MKILGLEINKASKSTVERTPENKDHQSQQIVNYVGDLIDSVFSGEKFPGGFGTTKDYTYVDYYLLRKRSVQLFKENPYARGIMRRLLRNEINSGLILEANAMPDVIGLTEDEATAWDQESETDWKLWGDDPLQCDFKKQNTIGKLAEQCRQTALVSGDCLVILRMNKITGLPMVELIDGEKVKTPFGKTKNGNNRIIHGVELDKNDRHVAYWVSSFEDGKYKSKRIPAWGEKSGRKISWLVYGTDKRLDAVRGEPILALVLYMLRELDRAMNAEQRAATINGMLPLFITKTEKGSGGAGFGQGAIRKDQVVVTDNTGGESRNVNFQTNLPGTIMEMPYGQKPESFNTQRPNTNFKTFEEMIVNTFAWALEVPPEIVRLLFTNSFAASRQANNEFNVYLQYRSVANGNEFYQPIYKERLISAVLTNQLPAPGLIEAWRDKRQWRIVGGWTSAVWEGISRPSVDIQKDVRAAVEAISNGIGTVKWWTKRITGQNWRDVYKQRSREDEYAKELGLSFDYQENNNGEPIDGDTDQNVDARFIRKLIEKGIEEIQDRVEETEERIATLER